MVAELLRRASIVVAAAGLLAFAPAQAEPHFEDMTLQSRAYALELVGIRLAIVGAFDPIPEELEEVVEGIFEHDVPRFIGTLEALDPWVAEELLESLETVVEGVEEGEVGLMDLAYAKAWTQAAYDRVVPLERRTPAFWGAVLADLLLGEPGVGEALEEALGEDELWELPIGWGGLQRVEAIWAELLPLATAEEASFARQYLDFLGEIYPTPEPPAVLPSNPEEAEAPAQSLVGVLETVVDASLYTGRDFGRLAGALAAEAAVACEAYEIGADAIAFESLAAVLTHYEANLEDMLELFDPDLADAASGILESLLGSEDDDDEGSSDADGSDDDDDDDLDEPAEACMELMEALEEARTLLGG